MKTSPPGVSRGERVGFTRSAARRIANVVLGFEGGFRRAPPVHNRMGSDDSDAVLCRTTSAWSKGSSATLQIWAGPPGSETDTGVTLEAYNRYASLGSGKFCTVMLHRHGYYYAIAGDCSP